MYNTQYAEDLYKYESEHGISIFQEYKKGSEDRKLEMVDVLFSITKSGKGVPMTVLSDSDRDNILIALSESKASDNYNNGEFLLNNTGVNFLRGFFPELNQVHKRGKFGSVEDLYADDTYYRKVCEKVLKFTNSDSSILNWIILVNAAYCWNFRPVTAKSIYEIYGKKSDCKVLDSSAGYGARLLEAHFAENVTEYVGIDPNTADSCQNLIQYLGHGSFNTGTKEIVYKDCSEDFTTDRFPEYKEYFDLYFTSPPYFNTEEYSQDSTQSFKRFPEYKSWLMGFYRKTIHNACDMLKKDGTFIINIFEKEDKVPKIRQFTEFFLKERGWKIIKEDKYLLNQMPGNEKSMRKTDNNSEPIWIAEYGGNV